MKKIIIIVLSILLCGCTNNNSNLEIKTIKKEDNIEKEEVYKDLNNTPIGIYKLEGNKLIRLKKINKKLNIEEDIGIFQLYPSNEDIINLTKSFSESYQEEWSKYQKDISIKEGFNIKFYLNNNEFISYNILSPNDCMNKWEYLMNYLYDDYINRGKGFYSHIESNEYNDNTLFTSIKLQSSYQVSEITSPIKLTVFTYDTDDDFDEDNEYRGNSSYTMTICPEGINC